MKNGLLNWAVAQSRFNPTVARLEDQVSQLTKERDRLKDAAYQYIETLSECVSDQIDPSVNVGWMRMSPKLPEYVQAVEKERDQFAAKCAEMRGVLEEVAEFDSGEQDCIARDANHALSDQCGVGWLSPEKKKVLVEALTDCICTLGFANPETADGKTFWACRDRAKEALEMCR